MSREFTAVFEKHGRWYIGYVEEIPGVNTQGRTLSEARANLKEALQLILAENRLVVTRKHSASTKREPITVEV
jgi:predicted RNase H-like HicB family nuclease